MTSLPIDSEEFRSQLKNMSEDIKVEHTNSTKKIKSPIDNLKSKSIYKDTLTVINFLAKNGDNLPKRYAEFFNRALYLIIEDFLALYKEAFLLDSEKIREKREKIRLATGILDSVCLYIKLVFESPGIHVGKPEDRAIIFEILGRMESDLSKWYNSLKPLN